jgi:dCMP deaminase
MNAEKQRLRDWVFLKVAKDFSELSTGESRQTGAVLVKDNHIISTGYNGIPSGVEGKCERCSSGVKSGTQLDKCICVHAEANAIIQAARIGISTNNTVLYCTHKPCVPCLKELINAGVTKVYYLEEYPAEYPESLKRKIPVFKFELDNTERKLFYPGKETLFDNRVPSIVLTAEDESVLPLLYKYCRMIQKISSKEELRKTIKEFEEWLSNKRN